MFRAAIVLALVGLACAPVQADPFEAYNRDLVGECVSGAGADEGAPRVCLGAGATPCIAADGSSTFSHALCWDHEATTWNELIQRAANDVTTRHNHRGLQRLAAANAAWAAWAQANANTGRGKRAAASAKKLIATAATPASPPTVRSLSLSLLPNRSYSRSGVSEPSSVARSPASATHALLSPPSG